MWSLIFKTLISAIVIVAVSEIGGRSPRLGALLLTLPIVSILAFIMTWQNEHSMPPLVGLARETLILVPLGLPFFVPFALADRTGWFFWPTFASGVLLASITIGSWMYFAPTTTPDDPVVTNEMKTEE